MNPQENSKKSIPEEDEDSWSIWSILFSPVTWLGLFIGGIYLFSILPDKFAAGDYQGVCKGEPNADAPAYDPSVSGIHPIYFFERFDSTEDYDHDSLGNEEAFLTPWQGGAESQLVACIDITVDPQPTETCEYELGAPVLSYGYTYDIKLYEAQSAELIATIPHYDSAPTCPGVLDVGITELYPETASTYFSLLKQYVEIP